MKQQELYTVEDNLIIVQGWVGLAQLNKDHQLFVKDSPFDLNLIKLYVTNQQIAELTDKFGPTPTREALLQLTEQERNLPNELFFQMDILRKFEPEVQRLGKVNTPPFFHDKKLVFFGLESTGSILKINIV
jgi:hypothetical protein